MELEHTYKQSSDKEQDPNLICEACGFDLEALKCKLKCKRCGYFRSCSDLF